MTREIILHCLKSAIDEENCENCKIYGQTGEDHCFKDAVRAAIEILEQEPSYNSIKTELEPCDDAISRQTVLDAAEKIIERDTSGNNAVVNAMRAWSEFIKTLPSVTPQPNKWIPVSEKLPPNEEKSYWICTENGYQCQCRWTNVNHIFTYLTSDWHWHIMDLPQYDKVVAWMPLPLPYMQEVEE